MQTTVYLLSKTLNIPLFFALLYKAFEQMASLEAPTLFYGSEREILSGVYEKGDFVLVI